jgi:hypothetical protein
MGSSTRPETRTGRAEQKGRDIPAFLFSVIPALAGFFTLYQVFKGTFSKKAIPDYPLLFLRPSQACFGLIFRHS